MNKTPAESAAATVLVRKTSQITIFVISLIGLGLFAGLILVVIAFSNYKNVPSPIISQNSAQTSKCVFRLESDCVELELADTQDKLILGLSGRSFMPETSGMLFNFGSSGRQCMWMKDMKFSLDMIWLDESKTITDIKKNIAPETYPESFCSVGNTKYVIEVNAGIANKASLTIGQKLDF